MLPFLLFLGLSAGIAALAMGTTNTDSSSGGNRFGSAIDNLLGLASSGDTQYEDAKIFNAEEAEKNRLFQREMADLQYQRSLSSTQMQNYRDAGLNPSLMYGQMSDLQTSVPAGSEANAPSPSSGSLANLLGLAGNLGIQGSQVSAEIDYKRALAEEIRSRIPLNQQRVNEIINRISDLQASVDERRARVELMLSQKGLTDEQRSNISFEQSLKSGYLDLEKQKYELLSNKTAAEISKMNAEEKALLARANVSERELQEMIWTYSIRRAGLEKANFLTDQQINQANATAEKLRKEGVRVDQLVSQETNKTMTRQAIRNAASSDDPVTNIGGRFVMAVEYCADHLLGAITK